MDDTTIRPPYMNTCNFTFLEIDWKSILLGENEWIFLLETAARSVFMFLVILFSLRVLGKRGVKQLSVFELGVIIGLGSAAGDPMFYKEVGLLAGLMVFVIVIALYKLVTVLISKSEKFEQFVEGKPVCILKDGKLLLENFKKEPIALDEFFMQLRLDSVSQLGQVEQAFLETNGEVSIFYYEDEKVKPGLPILPGDIDRKITSIAKQGLYSCGECGFTEKISIPGAHLCHTCKSAGWLPAADKKRIT